ncbi:hypothetical protein GCM10018787_17340 [Streptomyces thermodiastaticus]|nr:hypothetical protein GCM10018787_17340 [Streptomyces thermodiastaticus]
MAVPLPLRLPMRDSLPLGSSAPSGRTCRAGICAPPLFPDPSACRSAWLKSSVAYGSSPERIGAPVTRPRAGAPSLGLAGRATVTGAGAGRETGHGGEEHEARPVHGTAAAQWTPTMRDALRITDPKGV